MLLGATALFDSMSVRSATHAGSWYSSNGNSLRSQLDKFFNNKFNAIPKARILLGPHAGFSYSGKRLGETFTVWDTNGAETVFILGPSHHVYFKNFAMVSDFDFYDTPLGKLPVDREKTQQLCELSHGGKPIFKVMDDEIDEDEHSFEMHCPFIKYRADLDSKTVKIVPVMISANEPEYLEAIVNGLAPFFQDKRNTFVISSDFCHWGSRFRYQAYIPKHIDPVIGNTKEICDLVQGIKSNSKVGDIEIFRSIEILDKLAMDIASFGSSKEWKSYINKTGNTICGEKPITVVLQLLEIFGVGKFSWLGYSQSSQVTSVSDSSVSYASGYAVDDR